MGGDCDYGITRPVYPCQWMQQGAFVGQRLPINSQAKGRGQRKEALWKGTLWGVYLWGCLAESSAGHPAGGGRCGHRS